MFVALVIQHTKRMQGIISLSIRYSRRILKELEFFGTFRKKNLKYQVSRKSVQLEPGCFMRTDERTDRQTNMMNVTAALRNFVNASKTTYAYRRLPIAELLPQASAKRAMFWCAYLHVFALYIYTVRI